MYTIGQLSKAFGLSRSTLLYYDKIGLLMPSARTSAGYRSYSEEDRKRLEQICLYRETGISLEDMKIILDTSKNSTEDLLEKRLSQLNQEMRLLEIQRQIIVQLLKRTSVLQQNQTVYKDTFIRILKKIGLGEPEMDKLHEEFERLSPAGHQNFLEFLGIPQEEIEKIRTYSKNFSEKL